MTFTCKKAVVVALGLALALPFAACQKKATVEEAQVEEQLPTETPMPVVPTQVVVPEEIKSKYKGVVIEVTDKDSNKKTDYTVNIGETLPLGNTGLKITVEAFLPSFTMAGDTFTSASADLTNPAAKVQIVDQSGAVPPFSRWLFSLYPQTHPYEHPKYAVLLKDYVAAK